MKIQSKKLPYQILQFMFLGGLLLSSCKSFNPHQIPDSPLPPPAYSSVNVPVSIPQQSLNKILNQVIPAVIIDDENLDMGNLEGELKLNRNGMASYTTLDSQRMQLTLPLKIEGELGLKKKGLGNLIQTRIPLDERVSPVFIINPTINPDWSISVQDFELVDLGGELSLDVFGMKVDLSGLLEKEINKWGEENLNSNSSIFSLKSFIDLAWNQVGRPFTINWEDEKSAFSIQPDSLKLKEYFGANQDLNLWLGLNGKVNTHPGDAAPSRAFPLPELSENSDSENHLEITLPWTISYEQLDELLGENFNGKQIRVDKKTMMTPSNLKSYAYGEFLGISMDFFATQTNGKSLEGEIYVIGKPAYDAVNETLYFEDINFKMESGNFGAQTSVGLKKRKIIKNIEKRAVFPIGETLAESLVTIEDRLSLKTGIANLEIEGLEVRPEDFFPSKNGLTVHMKAKGNVTIDWK